MIVALTYNCYKLITFRNIIGDFVHKFCYFNIIFKHLLGCVVCLHILVAFAGSFSIFSILIFKKLSYISMAALA